MTLSCAIDSPLRSLYQRITELAMDITQAHLDFGLWKGTGGERRLSTIHSQESDYLLVLRVKVPRWQQAEDVDVCLTDQGLKVSLEQRDRVVVPGYCDFSYSPEQLTTLIAIPQRALFYRSFWEVADHLVTVIFTKEAHPDHDHCR